MIVQCDFSKTANLKGVNVLNNVYYRSTSRHLKIGFIHIFQIANNIIFYETANFNRH